MEGRESMVSKRSRLILPVSFIMAVFAGSLQADEQTVKIIMPWDGEGTIHSIDVDKVLFMGALEGIMYVESATGELDAAFANCPTNQYINVKTRKTEASGYCNIAISGDDTVFAEWSCSGEIGVCKGTFTLNGGTGKYKGVTGSSELVIRSVLSSLVAGMSSGSVVRAASGLAVLPKLTYKTASGK